MMRKMSSLLPKRAKREKLKSALAIMGPSGSGKTLGSLLMAYGMVQEMYPNLSDDEIWAKIGLVDSERRRSLVYANTEHQGVRIGEFWHIELTHPYTVDRYCEATKNLVDAGCEVVILDSISHAWEGDGGLLDLQQTMGGTFQAWRDVNPTYTKFIDLITGELYDVNIISTLRLKQKHEVTTSETGKLEVVKLGLKPVQRDSLEYELQIVFNVDMDNMASASKDNSSLFTGKRFPITPQVGADIAKWLDKGIDVRAEQRQRQQAILKKLEAYKEKYGEPVEAKIRGIEKHPSIERTIYEMPLEWLEKTLGVVELTISEIEKTKNKGEKENERNNK